MPEPTRATELRYRIVCYPLEDDTETMILDTTARAFIAVTGTVDEHGTMHGRGTHAGPLPLLKRIARLIAEDEQLARRAKPPRPPLRRRGIVRPSPYRSRNPTSNPPEAADEPPQPRPQRHRADQGQAAGRDKTTGLAASPATR